jgi:hypothetical protein
MKTRAAELKIGDVVMPPPRELRLWMRRACEERNLPESALHLTITAIRKDVARDAGGAWLLIETHQSSEWLGGGKPYPFGFRVRPDTPWVTIRRACTR